MIGAKERVQKMLSEQAWLEVERKNLIFKFEMLAQSMVDLELKETNLKHEIEFEMSFYDLAIETCGDACEIGGHISCAGSGLLVFQIGEKCL